MINKFISKLKNKLRDKDIKEILLGSSLALIYRIFGMIGGYILLLVVSRYYGSKGLGIYNLLTSVLTIFVLIGTLGLKTYSLRFVSQFYTEGKYRKIFDLYKNIVQLTIPISILLSVLLFIFAKELSMYVFKDESLVLGFKIIGLIIPFMVLYSINIEFIRGLKNIKFSEFLRNLTVPLFNTVFLVLFALFMTGYYVAVISYTIAIAISFLLSTCYIIKIILGFKKYQHDNILKKEILKVSLPMVVTAFSFFIMGKTDTIMIGMFSTMENVGIYNAALKLASLTSFILMAINTVSAPKFSELYWSNKVEDLRKVVQFSSKLIFLFSIPVLCILLILPQFSLGLFGEEFKIGKYALIFLVIGQFINATSGSVGIFFNMTGDQNLFRNIMLIAVVINIVLNYILIPKYGINGAAIATMVSMSFWNIAGAINIKLKYNINTFYIPIILDRKHYFVKEAQET
ncbi:MAG: flippase [Candidatus Jettenia sp.]|uniref:Uncharacterized protein n=1 Tax=Candidatus Jettenia caeni TaxID=247490 RepID=I3IQT8_9BACT|nr:flippase [Candidatus Jettenia sp. AMX1]MBC6928199.1 flippase [Candidatus Jettenia sp.]GAB64083.1 conserved hypothetical protein [Candidatus Jettenia caeni]KAA0248994.1 MAG: flippase [Candidatus Jettenia sp. AMX1]MCE7879588.1 flippase [Candidatus Jettenia sp. AMX1]MCQ3926947.1 flippase [Candidatus Jettenia sp.]